MNKRIIPYFILSASPTKSVHDNNYDEIIPNLYIGNYESIKDHKEFHTIINCTKHIPFPISLNIQKLRIAINDHETENENILKQCPTAIELIHNSLQQNKKVLVHCHAGMQRSCAIVAMYLMKYYKINNQRMTPTNAIVYIRSKRPIAFQPVPTFEHAMQTYYTSLQPV